MPRSSLLHGWGLDDNLVSPESPKLLASLESLLLLGRADLVLARVTQVQLELLAHLQVIKHIRQECSSTITSPLLGSSYDIVVTLCIRASNTWLWLS